MSDLEERVYSAVPGYDRLNATIVELRARAAAVRVKGESDETVLGRLWAQVVDTGEIPAEPEVEVLAARQATEAAELRRIFLVRAISNCEGARDSAFDQSDKNGVVHHQAAFDVLAGEVDEISETLRSIDVPANADDAVATDRVDALRTALDCVNRYDEVRRIYIDLWRRVGTNLGHEQHNAWLTADVLLRHDPATRRRLGSPNPTSIDPSGVQAPLETWPGYIEGFNTGRWPVHDEDRLAWLVWAAKHDGLWAPSPAEVLTAREEIRDAVREAIQAINAGRPKPQLSETARVSREIKRLAHRAARDAE